ncbi:DsbA family protein [Cumulibacter manganitolerans]|uniref:DsbA family protein n=1 Tax=Cumulibacter manganitolerans TaxID=1884992 RepID=UPI00129503DC|nr:thioredoxin domain-containing protein [Cumulibacter manganitolerans]
MSNSKKRTVKPGGSTGAPDRAGASKPASTAKSPSARAATARSNATGPKVGKKPATRSQPSKDRAKALADARKAAAGRGGSQTTIWIVAAVLVAALVVAGIIAVNSSNSEKEKAAASIDLGTGAVASNAITWGEQAAPVTIDYWVDLLCPACRAYETQAAPTVEKAVKDGKAKLVVHPVAILNNSSSPAGYSTRAGAAVMCAGDQPKGYLYMKELYNEQPAEGGPGLSDKELISIGEKVGLGDAWTKCVTDGAQKDAPTANTDEFDKKGFKGTPTVLVNGTQMTSGTVAELSKAIDAAAA